MGFILGMTTFSIGAWLLNLSFSAMVQGAQVGNFIGLVGWVVNVVLLCFLHWQLAVRSFSLCHQIPDRVSQWFGAHASNLGEESDFGAAKGFVGGIVTGKLAGGVGQGVKGVVGMPSAIGDIQEKKAEREFRQGQRAAASAPKVDSGDDPKGPPGGGDGKDGKNK